MSGARLTELFANIKNSFVSFFSIIMFVALAVGLFLGIQGTADTLERSAELDFAQANFHDFEVLFPYGLTQESLDALAKMDEVGEVEPIYLAYVNHASGSASSPLALRSLTSTLDLSQASEGELPSSAGEIALGSVYARENGIKIGDTMRLVHDAADEADADGMRYLKYSEFKVTGFVTNPNFISQLGGNIGMSASGEVLKTFAFVTEDSFDADAFQGLYPGAVLSCPSLRGFDTFSEEYAARSSALKDKLVELGEPYAKARYDAITSEAKEQIEEAQAQIDEGEEMLAEANQQIAEGEAQLISGQAQVDAALAQLEAGQATYEETRAQIENTITTMREGVDRVRSMYNSAVAELEKRRATFDEIKRQAEGISDYIDGFAGGIVAEIRHLNELKQKVDSGEIAQEEYDLELEMKAATINAMITSFKETLRNRYPLIVQLFEWLVDFPEFDKDDVAGWVDRASEMLARFDGVVAGAKGMLERAREEFDAFQERVRSLDSQLESAVSQFESSEARFRDSLEAARQSLLDIQAQAAQGQATIDEKTVELEEGKKTVEEKTVELEEGKAQLEIARGEVDKLLFTSWIINPRANSSGAITLNNILHLIKNLRVAMASLFVIVGLLVCYSAISRIVHEQVTQIGTKKALGFRPGEVTSTYIAYTACATLAGVVLGILVSMLVVQGILYPRIAANFDLERLGPSFGFRDTALIGAVELALLLGCTYFACRSVLKRSAIDLLAGEQTANATTRFYERWPIWRKLPLLSQTVINNCVNDPRRVLGTLVGVAGCTALIVTAMTLDGNITRSLDEQFVSVYSYDETVRFNSSAEGSLESIEAALDAQGCNYAAVQESLYLIESEEAAFENVIVPSDSDEFAQVYQLNAVPTEGTAPVGGAWVSRSHADHRGMKVGDKIVICNTGGERFSVTISGFFSFYLPYNTIIMSPEYYESVFGRAPQANALFVDKPEGLGHEALVESLSGIRGYNSASDERQTVSGIINLFKSVTSSVVAIYIGLAALMSVIVLLNLDYMFISEKKRELIVLMINGYSVGSAKAYIYRDAIVMTILGIVAGVALGIVTGGVSVGAVEWQSCSFIKDPYIPGCLIGAGLAAVFAMAMMLVALRRIPRFALTDISRY